MPVVATINGGFYKLFLVLHIFCAIVGFGAVYLNALYGQEIRKRRGPDALAVYEAKRMGVLMWEMIAGGPPPQAAEMGELGKKIGATGATLNVLMVVILFLMVWHPGA